MLSTKPWGWDLKRHQVSSWCCVTQLSVPSWAGLEGTTIPFGPFSTPPPPTNNGETICIHIYSDHCVDPCSRSQTKHAVSVGVGVFPALQMLLQQLCREVTGGFCTPIGSHCRESHTTKACRCFPYLCGYSFWNESVEMHLAYCLKKKKIAWQWCGLFTLALTAHPHWTMVRFYVIQKGHGYNASLWTARLPSRVGGSEGKGNPEMW